MTCRCEGESESGNWRNCWAVARWHGQRGILPRPYMPRSRRQRPSCSLSLAETGRVPCPESVQDSDFSQFRDPSVRVNAVKLIGTETVAVW